MNPLMDALKLAEHARPAPAAHGGDGSSAPAISGSRLIDPARTTKNDDTGPDAESPAARSVNGSPAPALPGSRLIDSVRMTKDDDTDPDAAAAAAVACGGADEPSGPDVSGGWRLEPIRAMRDDGETDAVELDFDLAAPVRSPSARSVLSGESSGSAGGSADGHPDSYDDAIGGSGAPSVILHGAALPFLSPVGEGVVGGAPARPLSDEMSPRPVGRHSGEVPHPSMSADPARVMADEGDATGCRRLLPERPDAGESYPATYRTFDARNLPRRRGVVRFIGTALAMLAVTGAGVGGGYFIWKTEFVRPALVRGLPAMSVPVTDLAPVHVANAATIVVGESAADTAFQADGRLPVPVPEAAEPSLRTSPETLAAGLTASETPGEFRRNAAAANAAMIVPGESAADTAFRAGGRLPVPVPEAVEPSPRTAPETLAAGLTASETPGKFRRNAAVEVSDSEDMVRSLTVSNGGVGVAASEGPEESPSIPAAESAASKRGERELTPAPAAHLPEHPISAPSPSSAPSTSSPSSRLSTPSTPSTPSASSPPFTPSPSPTSPPGQAGRAWSGHGGDPSGIREPAPPPSPAVEPTARAAAGASPGVVEHRVTAVERAGAEPPPVPGAGIEIRKRIRADHVTASIERAYEAFVAGDAESAAEAYRAVLVHEPGNRDAHLGLAAVAARAGRWDEAAGHYTRVLASHPADTVARAALIALNEQDPARGESRLKALLWNEPQAAYLHFNLGNLYAAQSRWPEARQSYFNAYRFDRRNADYAYNLAVSLDHLSQTESALGLYREALVLSRNRPAGFEAAAVRQRIRDLDTPAGLARPAAEAGATVPGAHIR